MYSFSFVFLSGINLCNSGQCRSAELNVKNIIPEEELIREFHKEREVSTIPKEREVSTIPPEVNQYLGAP